MHGQASLEFMAYIAILLVVMVIAANSAIDTGININNERINTDAKRIATMLATEINIAVEIGDGYSRTISVPETLADGTDYAIGTGQQRVFVSWSGRNYTLPVIAANITGTPAKGTTVIKNNNGVIQFA